MTTAADAVVIGGGVVGLAAADAVARQGQTVRPSRSPSPRRMETSTHNSGVIHAGLYYPSGSLKAPCVEGRERLYEYCRQRDVPHAPCEKLIVARDIAEASELAQLRERACAKASK